MLILCLANLLFWSGLVMAGDCPEGNKITQLKSNSSSFKAVEPLDFSKINSAGAYLSKNGTKVKVCLSNGNFKIAQMANDFVLPIKKKNEFIAVINFTNANKPIVPGKYSGAAGYGKPFWAFAEVKLYKGEKGVVLSLGTVEGTATIVRMTEESMCGHFDLKNKKGDSAISGEFNLKIEKSRW
jgi:hypothetical protein